VLSRPRQREHGFCLASQQGMNTEGWMRPRRARAAIFFRPPCEQTWPETKNAMGRVLVLRGEWNSRGRGGRGAYYGR